MVYRVSRIDDGGGDGGGALQANKKASEISHLGGLQIS